MHSFSVTFANIAIRHILLKTRFLWLHLCCRQYRFNFNNSDVIGSKAAEFYRITQNNGHYTVLGHSRSPILVPSKAGMRFPITESCTVSKLLVKVLLLTGATFLEHTRSGWIHNLKTMKFGFNKLGASLYQMCEMYFDILNHIGVAQVWQTDGQTDRTAKICIVVCENWLAWSRCSIRHRSHLYEIGSIHSSTTFCAR